MAESDFQRKPLMYVIGSLDHFFRDRPDVYVSGDMFVYYERGVPESVVAPDVFVAIGVAKHDRGSYRLWEEGKAPDFVMEITSESTRLKDQGMKRGIYALLNVREYFQFDPTGDYLKPPLLGLRLVDGNYMPIHGIRLPDGILSLRSEVLGLDLRLEGDRLRLYNPATGEKLLAHAEAEQARREAEAKAGKEAAARREAEAEVERLRAELARLRGEANNSR
ncbi:MAG: Uma2 family endonuclease [Chloroflexi bacterium]|nr:Uma2 family endonuclease [Chloroflexota bacterium]